MTRAIYPGSFDPVTFGHLDIIERSTKIVDELVVAVLINSAKKSLFSIDERVKMLSDLLSGYENIRVESFGGLLVDFARENDASIIVRGLRAVTDFEYELQISQMNRTIYNEIDTIFLTTSLEYAYLSSSIVKEVASYGGDISHFVPESVALRIKEKMNL